MRRKSLFFLILAISALSLFLAVSKASAQKDIPTDDQVNRVAKKLYCPVCPNTPLDVCETKACQDWRAQIKDQLAAGWTDQQVIDYFVAQYGERVLAQPPRRAWFSCGRCCAAGRPLIAGKPSAPGLPLRQPSRPPLWNGSSASYRSY